MTEMPTGYRNVGVVLPSSVVKIITAAGGGDAATGGLPFAMASIIGALPWIAVALSKELTKEEYREFVNQVRAELQGAFAIVAAEDPKRAFDEAYERAKTAIN